MAAVPGDLDVVVLSPHQDDAAFSLGLTLARLAAAGRRVCVLNCFTHSAYAPHGADGDVVRVMVERPHAIRARKRTGQNDVDQRNKSLKPFVWTTDADLILG